MFPGRIIILPSNYRAIQYLRNIILEYYKIYELLKKYSKESRVCYDKNH